MNQLFDSSLFRNMVQLLPCHLFYAKEPVHSLTNEEKMLITQNVKEVGEIMSNHVSIVFNQCGLKTGYAFEKRCPCRRQLPEQHGQIWIL